MSREPLFGRLRFTSRRRRLLCLEPLEPRRVLACSGATPAIGGTVFRDLNDDGQPSAGEAHVGVDVHLYLDDGDGVFEPNAGDVAQGSTISTDANGEYCVETLDPDGAYFVHLPPQTVGGIALEEQVSSLIQPGLPGLVIDAFQTTQSTLASPPAPATESSVLPLTDETEVIGQERDITAFLDSGDGAVDVSVNPFGTVTSLRYNADVDVVGRSNISWDGTDGTAATLGMGLNGRDLTRGGLETGIAFRIGSVATGSTAEFRLYQGDSSNFSQATLAIPVTTGGAADTYQFIPFSSFTGPVAPTNVDAIELIVDATQSPSNNIELAQLGANGPKVANFIATAETDLTITKTDNLTTAVPGGTLTYTVVVANQGPSEVTGARVTDDFPAALTNVTFTSAASGGATGNTTSGSGSLSETLNMPVGSSVTYTIAATVSPSATGTLTNTATVIAPEGFTDSNLDNNSAVDADSLAANADLTITKTNSTNQSVPGQQITYTITVTNEGPSNVIDAAVSDDFPASLTGATYTSTATVGAIGNTVSGTGDINDTVSMTVGSSITYTVTGTVASNATGSISNTAVVTAPENVIDPDPANNTASDTDTLSSEMDLQITKTDNVSSVEAGDTVNYTIVVTNAGPADAVGATVVDSFPAALQNVTFTSTATAGVIGNTASGSGNINDTVTLPAAATLTYQVTATVSSSASGTLQNTATVNAPASATDPVTSNNSATDIDTIVSLVDLAVTKTNGQTEVGAGEITTYTIQVSNLGPGAVDGATITDSFPAALTNVTFTSTAGGGATGNTVNGTGNINDVVDLPAGSSITYTVTGRVSATATGTLANTATVITSGQQDTNQDNNTATDTDTIVQRADLAITKSDNRSTINSGEALVYQIIVTNNGPSNVTGATIIDNFPATLTNVSYTSTASGGATGNTQGTGNLSETVNLPAGSSIQYTVNATLSTTATSGVLSNTVTASAPAGVTDPTPANNSATDTTSIQQVLRSISGFVYVDRNDNGAFEPGEPALRDVAVSLSGTDQAGNTISRSTTTDFTGAYEFDDLAPGTYQVSETQPVLFADGRETIGTGSSTTVQATDNVFANIGLGTTQDAIGFNFGEGRTTFSKRDLLASNFR